MEVEILNPLNALVQAVWFVALLALSLLVGYLMVILIRATVKAVKRLKLRRVYLKQMKNGDQLLVPDDGYKWFSCRVIHIGNESYYPVLKMKDGKVIIDHIFHDYDGGCYPEKLTGKVYQNLLLREKAYRLQKEI